jgi:hypothetical protein
MSEPLTPAQADSLRILQDAAEATIKLGELKRAYDMANPPMAAPTHALEVATAIEEILGRTNQRSTVGQYLRSGNTGGELRKDQIAVAREWESQLLKDPEQLRRVETDDPDMRSKRVLHAVWAAGPHERGFGRSAC